jgi:hypothetical protein
MLCESRLVRLSGLLGVTRARQVIVGQVVEMKQSQTDSTSERFPSNFCNPNVRLAVHSARYTNARLLESAQNVRAEIQSLRDP